MSKQLLLPLLSVLSLLCFARTQASAQELPRARQSAYIADLKARYYRPRDAGLASFTCEVKFDLDTMPKALLIPAELAGRGPIESTQMQLTMNSRGQPSLNKTFPPSASAVMLSVYKKFFEVAGNLVTGFAATWAAKATNGPIPNVSDVLSVTPGTPLTRIHLPDPGAKLEVLVNDQLLVTEILTASPQETIDEHPTFTPSAQGLLFTANDTSMKQGEDSTHVRYEVSYQEVAGFELPQNVHLVVNDSINIKFHLASCVVQRGTTLEVRAP